MQNAIVWFKTDLRVHDNETLVKAIEQNYKIIPVYCFDEAHFKTTEFGFHKTGSFRAQFLLESLLDLDKNLRDLGSGLTVVHGKPENEIIELVKKFNVQKVFAQQEIAPEEMHKQALVQKELLKVNYQFETFKTSTLYHENDLPFLINDIPDVFTNFRKLVEKDAVIRSVFAKPTAINSPEIMPLNLPSLAQLGIENTMPDSRAVLDFKGGETATWNRLEHYFFETKSLSNYKLTRNELVGANYSSKFSAWLALGCISARSIYHEIQAYERKIIANDSTYWLVFELLWRDYFKFVMQKYGSLFFLKKGIKPAALQPRNFNLELFKKWENGQTTNDFINSIKKVLFSRVSSS